MTQTKPKTWIERGEPLSGRISPRDVLEAYEMTGYEPSRTWFDVVHVPEHDCTHLMACALTAMAGVKAIEEDRPFIPNFVDADIIEEYIFGIVGLDDWYLNGFVGGFDGNAKPSKSHPRECAGYRDGRRASRFVLGEST